MSKQETTFSMRNKIESTVSKFEDLLSQNRKYKPSNNLEKANNLYNNLIKKGLIKKKGNTLKNINEVNFSNLNANI